MQTQKINITFRLIFIAILAIVCLCASSFMVLESSEFFERFYLAEDSKNFGFVSALLNEVFLVIMASVWVPAIRKGESKKFHPANILIKGLVILLFVNTVGGASLNTVQKKLTVIQEQKNRIEVLSILQSQIEDQQRNINTFRGQNQKTNTVLATRKLNEVKEELKKLQTSRQSSATLWLDILLITLVRFTIQLANITAVWLASWLYRTMPLAKQMPLLTLPLVEVAKNLPLEPQKRAKKNLNLTPIKNNYTAKNNSISPKKLYKKKIQNSSTNDKFTVQKIVPQEPKNLHTKHHKIEAPVYLEEHTIDKAQLTSQLQDSLADLTNAEGVSRALAIPLGKLIKLKQGETTEFEITEMIKLKKKINLLKEQSL